MIDFPYRFRRGEVLALMARACIFGMFLGAIAIVVLFLVATHR